MGRYLIKVTETYRLPDEEAVEKFLSELKSDNSFEISKYSSCKKQKKVKGEIEDEWIRFEVTKLFNMESEPDNEITIQYEKENEDKEEEVEFGE